MKFLRYLIPFLWYCFGIVRVLKVIDPDRNHEESFKEIGDKNESESEEKQQKLFENIMRKEDLQNWHSQDILNARETVTCSD